MSLLSWFRGAQKPQKDEPYVKADFFFIPSLDYFGWFSVSPNGQYVITWRDANDAGTHGGARSSGKGRYYLLDRLSIVAGDQLERPNDGKVANNGTFILNDWKFSGDLVGEFHAFRADGTTILSKPFNANLYNNGISPDGNIAVCQSCYSSTNEGGVLAVFDLMRAIQIAEWIPESGWAQSYDFPDDGKTIRLCYPGGGSFAYSIDGAFLDRETWVQWSLDKGDLRVAEQILKDVGGTPDSALAARLVKSVDIALAACKRGDVHTAAWGHKLRGICLESQGDNRRALQSYEQAFKLDPKVGVKRRAEALKKGLSK